MIIVDKKELMAYNKCITIKSDGGTDPMMSQQPTDKARC